MQHYGNPVTVTPPPGLVAGEEWWQQLVSYGFGRYVDSETLQAYQVNDVARQLGMGANGGLYTRGQPGAMIGGISPLLLVAGVLVVGGVAYLALK